MHGTQSINNPVDSNGYGINIHIQVLNNPSFKETGINKESVEKASFNRYCTKGEIAQMKDIKNLGLEEDDLDRIYVCNRNGNYTMFHYKPDYNERSVIDNTDDHQTTNTQTSWGDQDSASHQKQEMMKNRISEVRGWIYDETKREICCKSFGETVIAFIEQDGLYKYHEEGYTFKQYVEGTTIRLFWDNYNNEWIHSSHRKINCDKSKVPGMIQNFKQMFDESCPNLDYSLLNKEKIYIIQVVHKENQIMNQEVVEGAKSYHLATVDRSTLQIVDEPISEKDKIPQFNYLEALSLEQAKTYIAQRTWIMAKKNFKIVQLVSRKQENLFQIRQYTESPYQPIELLYLRLSVKDRPLLVDAVPPHQKKKASVIYMEKYISRKSEELAKFCADALLNKIRGYNYIMGKTLVWLLKQIVIQNKNIGFETIKILYQSFIFDLYKDNGETFYRAIKDMDTAKKTFQKTGFRKRSTSPNKTINNHPIHIEEVSQIKRSPIEKKVNEKQNPQSFAINFLEQLTKNKIIIN